MYVSYTYRISYVYVWGEGRLSENVGHHGWRITKKFKMTLNKMPQNSPKKTKLHSKNLAHFTSLSSLNITKNIFLEHIQKHVSGWCHKKRRKHFYCSISRHPSTAFSKHLEIKCLYIPVDCSYKIFTPET